MIDNLDAIKALAAAKKEIPKITKDHENPFHKNKYAHIDSILDVVDPIFERHGLMLLQPSFESPDGMGIQTIVVHIETGQQIDLGRGVIRIDKNGAQACGSALTYGRRYFLVSSLGLTTGDDDDGARASMPKNVDDVMTIKTRIMGIVGDLGFKDAAEMKSIVNKVVQHTGADSTADGWLAVEKFMKTLTKESVLDFLNS